MTTQRVAVLVDWRCNRGNPRMQLMLLCFRIISALRGTGTLYLASRALEIPYRIVFEWLGGVELRPKTVVGPRLTIYHGTGLVVNDACKIGADVVLRNGVVIGNDGPAGVCPELGDGVVVGANAVIIGPVKVGAGAKIGAGAVVITDVPNGRTAVGNPARVVGA